MMKILIPVLVRVISHLRQVPIKHGKIGICERPHPLPAMGIFSFTELYLVVVVSRTGADYFNKKYIGKGANIAQQTANVRPREAG